MPYSTVSLIRENVAVAKETYTGVTGTLVFFPDAYTTSIISVNKNNTILASGTDYTFFYPNKLSLATGLATGDYIIVNRGVHLTDGEINNIQAKVDTWIDGYLSQAWVLPFASGTPPMVQEISTECSQAHVIFQLATKFDYNVVPREMDWASGALFRNMQKLEMLKIGGASGLDLVDSGYNLIPRRFDSRRLNTIYVGLDDSTIPK